MTQQEQLSANCSRHTLIIPDPLWKKLRILGIDDKTSASWHVRKAIEKYLGVRHITDHKTAS